MIGNLNKHQEFYRAFEDRFRGSRELIRSRLEVYKPFLDLVRKLDGPHLALDLGCGRGEWLELLRDSDFKATGVDQDESMLAACRERNLTVLMADAIEHITMIPDSSLALVSGFHIAEHLPFEKLQILIEQAYRSLKPGGILILETPNPENFYVSTLTFYLDPTHIHPIPPLLLSFLTEYYGFDRNKIVRVQESQTVSELKTVTLEQVFASASPDYAVIAQKKMGFIDCRLEDKTFAKEYGISSKDLLDRFETTLTASLTQQTQALESERSRREEQIDSLRHDLCEIIKENARRTEIIDENTSRIASIEKILGSITERLNNDDIYYRSLIEKEKNERLSCEKKISALYSSTSWRVTAPLRVAGKTLRWFLNGSAAWLKLKPGSRPRRTLHTSITHAMLWFRNRPTFFLTALRIIHLFPPLERRLLASAHARGLGLSYSSAPAGDIRWELDVEPQINEKWQRILK